MPSDTAPDQPFICGLDATLRVDYAATPLGLSLAEAMAPLCNWGDAHRDSIAAALARRKQARPDRP